MPGGGSGSFLEGAGNGGGGYYRKGGSVPIRGEKERPWGGGIKTRDLGTLSKRNLQIRRNRVIASEGRRRRAGRKENMEKGKGRSYGA